MTRVCNNERKYVLEVLDSEFRTSLGSVMTTRLEENFAKKFGTNFAISHINGTATLHSALYAAGVGPGEEIIVPPLTMSSTSFAVLQQNAIPVFADIDKKTFEISPESIEKCITKKTKAIMTVALYGLSPDMDKIMKIAKEHDLVVIEDDAQCFLAKYKGKLVGTIGDISSFSFQSSKHMTSGEGGMILTNNEKYANAIRRFSSLGYKGVSSKKGKITKKDIQDPQYERHVCLGYNYRMSELCAAVALGQLEHLDELVGCRVYAAKKFDAVLKEKNCEWLIPQFVPDDCTNSYWTYVVKLQTDDFSWYEFRDKFMEFGGDGIYAAWQLTYLEPVFRNKFFNGLEKLFSNSFWQKYERGLCPIAELTQPKLLQFKTNYWDKSDADEQASILSKTIDYFDKK
ncbi:MAG: DegT/DnrJ/EryC1/StrS family aminotransferase [Candidatus Altiarchaeales archaeon HGW-Altiarchaeales-2]|nr:MAG: DegT/DnrJ/EryC1/StrS family aminotransferase [Candidatus Altiarchaeales archaeon HGW-Altiarchaeales-2]